MVMKMQEVEILDRRFVSLKERIYFLKGEEEVLCYSYTPGYFEIYDTN